MGGDQVEPVSLLQVMEISAIVDQRKNGAHLFAATRPGSRNGINDKKPLLPVEFETVET